MIAAHFDSLLFLLLVAVAVFFQLLAKAVAKTAKNQTRRTSTPIPRTPPPNPRAPTESSEEKIRKLLEALGQPPTSKPPAPVVPRMGVPPRPLAPVRPPIAHLSREWKAILKERRKREVIPKEGRSSPSITRAEETVPPKIIDAPAFEVHEGPLPIAPPPIFKASAEAYAERMRTSAKTEEPKTDIATLLASASGLRNAMILREILGPPRSLRAL
jgi:hypothetical protein